MKEEIEGDLGSKAFNDFEIDLEKKFDDRITPIVNKFDFKNLKEVPWAEWT